MRVERIVAGIDFSVRSLDALRWATLLAPSAEVILVHAVDLPAPPPFAPGLLSEPRERMDSLFEADEARLRALFDDRPGARRRYEVRAGHAHEVLALVAAEHHADLVVVGSHGSSDPRRRRLGTTAERLVRTSPVPVLVAAHPADGPPRRLLVAVDGSPVTVAVLRWVGEIAETFGADITAVHVLSNAAYSHAASMASVTTPNAEAAEEALDETMRSEGVAWLERIAAAEVGVENVQVTVTFGNASDEILDLARDLKVDLVVIGRRGSGRIIPLLLGSTVGKVLDEAPCPVLVITDAE